MWGLSPDLVVEVCKGTNSWASWSRHRCMQFVHKEYVFNIGGIVSPSRRKHTSGPPGGEICQTPIYEYYSLRSWTWEEEDNCPGIMARLSIMYRSNLSAELSSIAGDLALGIPKGGGSVSAPHLIMSNDGRMVVQTPSPLKVRPI